MCYICKKEFVYDDNDNGITFRKHNEVKDHCS